MFKPLWFFIICAAISISLSHAGINPFNGVLSSSARVNERVQCVTPSIVPDSTHRVSVNSGINTLLIIPVETVSTMTITCPSGVYNGHIFSLVCSSANVTTLTMEGASGQTIKNALTSISSGEHGTWIYYSTAWYRKE